MKRFLTISLFVLIGCLQSYAQCANYTIVVGGGTFDSEITWSLTGTGSGLVATGGAPSTGVYCLDADCYSLVLSDSFGDGWNGAIITISDLSGVVYTGTLAAGVSSIETMALNGGSCGPPCTETEYNITVGGGTFDSEVSWTLVDDAGNNLASGIAPYAGVICAADGCLTLTMNDTFGDGWNGAQFVMTDAMGNVISSSTLEDGATATSDFPIGSAACGGGGACEDYWITVGGGTFDSEVTWNISGDFGTIISGAAPITSSFCVEPGCFSVNMIDSFGDGWNGAVWSITDAMGVVVSSGGLGAGSTGTAGVALGGADCDFPGPITASDCHDAIDVCTDIDFYVDPNGYGSVYEIPASGSTSNPYYDGLTTFNPWGTNNTGCLLSQELNSTWMTVNIAVGGWLEFVFGGLGTQAGFYDWAMWTFDENTCGNIIGDLQAPIRCNWNGAPTGGTGLAGVLPAGGDVSNFEPPLWVEAGDVFLICFSNYSSVSSNVPLEFSGTAEVSCEPIMLPVDLVDLSGESRHDGVLVQWKTLSEQDNAMFVLERSMNTMQWQEIAMVEGAGDSFELRKYKFLDLKAEVGVNYYRLRQIDFDGNSRFSEGISVDHSPQVGFQISPNPIAANQSVKIKFRNISSDMSCVISTIDGRFIEEISLGEINTTQEIKFENAGMYLIRLVDSEGAVIESRRLVVQ